MSSTSFLDFLYVWARPHYCILLLCVFAVLSVVTTYGIAVGLNHVPAFLPYIIDAASNPPESCIFAQFMNFVAMFLCIVIYIRYRQVVEESQLWSKDTTTGPEESTPIKSQELSSTTAKLRELPLMCKPLKISTTTAPLQESKLLRNLNAFALILGFLGSFGLSLVANFQRTNVPLVHLSGTFMLFVFGFAYSWIQVYLTYKSVKRGIEMIVYDKMGMLLNNCKLLFRLTLSILMTIYFICGIVTLTTSNLKWTNQYGASSKKSRLLWTTEDPGYTDHIISTFCEWLTVICLLMFCSSFWHEFGEIKLTINISKTDKS